MFAIDHAATALLIKRRVVTFVFVQIAVTLVLVGVLARRRIQK